MKKCLLSSPQKLDGVGRLQSYPINLMQHHQENAYTLVKEISQIIASHQVANVLLHEIALLLGNTFSVDYCCLIAIAQHNQVTSTNWCSEQSLDLLSLREMLLIEEFLLSLPLKQWENQPLITEDIAQIWENFRNHADYLPLQPQAFLVIPTKFNGYSNGLISLIKFQAYNWDEGEKQLLKVIEPSCAIAFSQVVLQQHLQKNDQHQNLIKQLTLLNRSNLELHQLLQLAIASIAKSLEVDRGLILLLKYTQSPFSPFRNRLKKQVPQAKATLMGEWSQETDNSCASNSDNLLDQSFSLSDCSLCQSVFTQSQPIIMIDGYRESTSEWHPYPVFAMENFGVTLLMTLENQGVILGFVVFQQRTKRSWELSELNLIEMLCAQLSNTIIQSQTLRQVQTLVEERTEQLKRSLDVQAKLYERTRLYVEQLQELNQLKDEFLSNISDRLRYPLTNMRMSIRNLRLPGISADRQSKYLDILESECTKEINLINDLLTLQKLESDQEVPEFETIDLPERIQELVANFHKQLLENRLTISLDLPEQPLKIQTELESFNRILQELLSNACKYSEYGTNIHFQATHQVEPMANQVMIKVTNIGYGISTAETAYIFDKFRRGKGRWTPGTGLGLALVKSLVQHLNGAIAVESNPISGSQFSEICFTLTLPQTGENRPYV